MPHDEPHDRTAVERIDPLVGATLQGKFRIEFRLAAGGFGAIYRARDLGTGQELAVKILHPRLTADAGVVARFRREGAALIKLRNPHTITAYELGETSDGTLYLVMELLHGVSLFERFRLRGPIEWKRMVTIARAVCDSLAEAHGLGIIHRDLKPTNIHLESREGNDDFVKVLDFGIAKIIKGGHLDNADLTHAGQMIGTLDYMPPEQMVGGVSDGASDIYTLGIVMYEMLTGHLPYPAAATAGTALAAMVNPPPSLASRAMVPPALDRLVMRCLEREPDRRYASAAQLAAALDQLLVAADDATGTVRFAKEDVNATVQAATDHEARTVPKDFDDEDATAVASAQLIASLTRQPVSARRAAPEQPRDTPITPTSLTEPDSTAPQPIPSFTPEPAPHRPDRPTRPSSEPATTAPPRPALFRLADKLRREPGPRAPTHLPEPAPTSTHSIAKVEAAASPRTAAKAQSKAPVPKPVAWPGPVSLSTLRADNTSTTPFDRASMPLSESEPESTVRVPMPSFKSPAVFAAATSLTTNPSRTTGRPASEPSPAQTLRGMGAQRRTPPRFVVVTPPASASKRAVRALWALVFVLAALVAVLAVHG